MKSTSFSKNGETHSRRRHRFQPQSIPFMAKKRVETGIPETPRSRRHTLQGYSKHGSHHRHSRRDNTARQPTRKPRRHRIRLRRHRIPLPQKLHANRSERSHTLPQTEKTQPRETYRLTSLETHDTLLQAKQTQMDGTVPYEIIVWSLFASTAMVTQTRDFIWWGWSRAPSVGLQVLLMLFCSGSEACGISLSAELG